MRKLIIFFLAAYWPLTTFAASTGPVLDERALREECSEFSQAGMRDCLAKKAESSQQSLMEAEDMLKTTLSKWDEDNKYINQAKAKFSASTKTFVKYREAQCSFAYALGGGAIGNALDMRRLACVTELNNRRAEQLRNAVADLPLK